MATKRRSRRAAPEAPPQPARVRAPILDLGELVERRYIIFAGAEYEMRNPGELSIYDQYYIAHRAGQLHDMMDGRDDQFDESTVELVGKTLNEMARIILIAPDEIHEKLNDNQRHRLVSAFTGLQGEALTETAPKGASEMSPSTGESTSRG
jgi:hypothetical protein